MVFRVGLKNTKNIVLSGLTIDYKGQMIFKTGLYPIPNFLKLLTFWVTQWWSIYSWKSNGPPRQ